MSEQKRAEDQNSKIEQQGSEQKTAKQNNQWGGEQETGEEQNRKLTRKRGANVLKDQICLSTPPAKRTLQSSNYTTTGNQFN